MKTQNRLIKPLIFIAVCLVVLILAYAYILYGSSREYRYETKKGDCFIVTANGLFDDYTLSVDEPDVNFYMDLDYFDPKEDDILIKSESDQRIVYEICGTQFCKDLSTGEFQLYP